jgi:formate hydrogenlyase subunit 4
MPARPLSAWLVQVACVLAWLLLAPLVPGLIVRVKAFVAGRKGRPTLQLYFDLWKLLRKGFVLSKTTTPVFWLGPVVGLAALVVAAAFVPFGALPPLFAFPGDVVLVVALLALQRFATTAAALDTGSAFTGMGAAREVLFGVLAEPALLLGFMILARLTAESHLGGVLGPRLADVWPMAVAPVSLVAAAWALVLLAENARVPFDDPNTHLELTMIHEVMILDHGGPLLALCEYAAALKLSLFALLLGRVAWPLPLRDPLLAVVAAWAGVMVVALAVGLVESLLARVRLVNVPKLLVSACLAGGFGLALLARR